MLINYMLYVCNMPYARVLELCKGAGKFSKGRGCFTTCRYSKICLCSLRQTTASSTHCSLRFDSPTSNNRKESFVGRKSLVGGGVGGAPLISTTLMPYFDYLCLPYADDSTATTPVDIPTIEVTILFLLSLHFLYGDK